jgi:hypothetical protein
LGLPSMIHDCWTDGQCDEDVWTAVVITHTPDTVLILLPPLSMPESDQRFVLIDSGDGGQKQFLTGSASPPTQAYARIHATLEDLVLELSRILPVVNLPAGHAEAINILYNSFDLYVFQHNPASA